MLFKDFVDMVNRISNRNTRDDLRIGIKTVKLNVVGGTYITDIQSIIKGFDWDNNKVIITPEHELREIEVDEISHIKKELSKLGWSDYEFRNLKRENKKLREQIKELEAKINA